MARGEPGRSISQGIRARANLLLIRNVIGTRPPLLFPITRLYAIVRLRDRLLITGSMGLEGRSVGPIGERLEKMAHDYEGWLSRQPLSANTRRTYRTRVRGFLEYLAATPAEYGDPLAEQHARDYTVRDYKTHLKTVGRARPSSVNLTLAAIDNFYRFMGMGKPDTKREDLPRVAPGALEPEEQKRFLRAVER
jgi:hypothetical protein